MNIIGLKYNITDNSYNKCIDTNEKCVRISPKTDNNEDYIGPVKEEINTTFIIISNPYNKFCEIFGLNNEVINVINVVSTNTGHMYIVLFDINNIINPNIIQYRRNNAIIQLKNMKDGDIAEVIEWHNNNYSFGTLIQRCGENIISLHNPIGETYSLFRNPNSVKDILNNNKVRILSKGTIIMI